jgi:hypothetical protein
MSNLIAIALALAAFDITIFPSVHRAWVDLDNFLLAWSGAMWLVVSTIAFVIYVALSVTITIN